MMEQSTSSNYFLPATAIKQLVMAAAIIWCLTAGRDAVAQDANNTANMSLAGKPNKATVIGLNEYELTKAVNWQAGSIWSKDYIDLNNNFTFEGQIYLGSKDGNGADGIAFVLQPYCTGLGLAGAGLGYGGIENSFAIEFDNLSNRELHEPVEDHIAFSLDGEVDYNKQQTKATTTNLEDNKYHAFKISWDALSKKISLELHADATIGSAKIANLTNENPLDLASKFNNGLVYWGFTSSTGNLNNLHKVKLTRWPASIIFPYVVTDATSKTGGSIEMKVPGDQLTYKWSDGPTGATRTGLKEGIYTVDVTSQVDLGDKTESCVSSFTIRIGTVPDLVGHWTFESGNERNDLTGNFEPVSVIDANIKDGHLNVSNGKWAISNLVSDIQIKERTLVAWAKINNLNVRGGSILSINTGLAQNDFDAIVYAEKEPKKWMSGSGAFGRTENPNNKPASEYEEEVNKLVKITITYAANNQIKAYRDNELIGSYTKGNILTYSEGTTVYFGVRHRLENGQKFPGSPWIDASIEEARIYNGVLTAEQIKNLTMVK